MGTERGGDDEGDGEPPVWWTDEFVTLAAEFPATFTSVSAVRDAQHLDNRPPQW